jgi:hypothetical protein
MTFSLARQASQLRRTAARISVLSLLLLLPIGLMAVGSSPAEAQNRWLPPQPIPFYDDVLPPIMVADQNRTVHAFNGQFDRDSGASAIYYRQWSLQRGWTRPNDIILPPREGTITPLDVYLDQNGVAHLIFFAGQSGVEGAIYYTRAPLALAAEARSWMRPVVLDNRAGPFPAAVLSSDGATRSSILYIGQSSGQGIYAIESSDLGETWSAPTTIYLINREGYSSNQVTSFYDHTGKLHAAWTIMDPTGLGEGVLYAGIAPNDEQWSRPFTLAERGPDDLATDAVSIVEYNGELIAMYLDGSPPPAQHLRRSTDGGNTWSQPVRSFRQAGGNGPAVMLEDSTGTLHIILASRIDALGIAGMWHGTWLGGRWSELDMISARTPQEAMAIGSYIETNQAHSPTAVMSQGNVILASWWHNVRTPPPAGYSYLSLGIPETPLVPLPVPDEAPDQEPLTPGSTEVAAVTPVPAIAPLNQTSSSAPNSAGLVTGQAILLGLIPTTLLILSIVVINRRRLASRFR